MQIEGIKFDADQPAVTVPEPITAIPERAFEGNGRIKVVRLPKTLRAIEDSAFRNCDELMSIEVPEGVKSLGFAIELRDRKSEEGHVLIASPKLVMKEE